VSEPPADNALMGRLHACEFCGGRVVARVECNFTVLDEPAILAALAIDHFDRTKLSIFVCAECVQRMGGLGERIETEGIAALAEGGVFAVPPPVPMPVLGVALGIAPPMDVAQALELLAWAVASTQAFDRDGLYDRAVQPRCVQAQQALDVVRAALGSD